MENSIGNFIRLFRTLRDLPQYKLASTIGKSQSWVCLVEKGYLVPSYDELEKIAKCLDFNVEKIIEQFSEQMK